MDSQFKNAVGDWFISDEKRELQRQELELEASKLDLLRDVANKEPAKNNSLIIIPIVIIAIGGVAALILTRKKK